MSTNLSKAVEQVLQGMEPSRAANVYRVRVKEIRHAIESNRRDPWGHASLETFVLRNSFQNADRAIQQFRGDL